VNTAAGAGGEAMSTSAPDEGTYPKRALYERIFVDRAFAEDAFQDRPPSEQPVVADH
jgi:hypothetical protein